MQASRILETALYVRDVAEAISFYRDIIGLEPVGKVSERNAFFRCGDGILLLFKAEETLKPPAPGSLPVPPHGTIGAAISKSTGLLSSLISNGPMVHVRFIFAIPPAIRWNSPNRNFGIKHDPKKWNPVFWIRSCVKR
jgi:catechol 2,3-dioxygenase-like lactoylglutathione lyase family enzyme